MTKEFNSIESNILKEIMQHRRDVRGNRFINTPLPEHAINHILESALYAPSVGYSQP